MGSKCCTWLCWYLQLVYYSAQESPVLMCSWTPNCNQWWNLHLTGFHDVYRCQECYAAIHYLIHHCVHGACMVMNTYWFTGMCRGGEGEGFEQGLIVAMCVDHPALQRRRGGGIWAGSDCCYVCRSSSIAEEERGRDLSWVWLLLWFPVLRCLIVWEMKYDSWWKKRKVKSWQPLEIEPGLLAQATTKL